MPNPFAVVAIAGVDLENTASDEAKCLVLDGANLFPTTAGSNDFAADGTVWTQVLTIIGGRAFGIHARVLETANLQAIIAAVETAIAAHNTFSVTATDHLHSFTFDCVPDFGAGWLKYAEQKLHPNQIKDVTFRFITVSEEES